MTTSPTTPDLTLAALNDLDGAAAPGPFTFGIGSKVVTFPDPMDLPAEETERFLTDMQSLSWPMEVFRRWLSDEDYQLLVDQRLTGRQAVLLLRQANRHYEAGMGSLGKGEPSSTD
ncbi:hypothetical protein [Actinomyces faecalis]|uniref:hypothetical protein n=1 Tax=Actinomyces faecalis TaxID=2722820 RepID=UPI001557B02B|nr:hypothetical protein [Actinomyces faecalis]